MADAVIQVHDEERVRVVTIDRPERRNAIDRHVYHALQDTFDDAAARDDVGAVLLTGAGDAAFSAGADLAELAAMGDGTGQEYSRAGNRFIATLAAYPLPIVMAVNGVAVGMGTTLLGFADLAFAAESARFRTPFTAMGISPELGSSFTLPNLLGWQRASWVLLSSEWIDAPTAARWGLVVDVVPDDDLLAHTTAAARTIAAHDTTSLRAVKQTMLSWKTAAVEHALDAEQAHFGDLLRARRSRDR